MEDIIISEQTISEEEPSLAFPESEYEQGEQAETAGEEAFSLKIKYNGKEQMLSKDKAVELAQKGMNYDHIKEQLDALKAQQGEAPAPDSETAYFQNQGIAQRIDDLQVQMNLLKAKEAAQAKWNEFQAQHPEFRDYRSLPQEVRTEVSLGKDLDMAYALYENKQLKQKLAALEKDESNKASTAGSLKSTGTADAADDFLRGFLNY